jgi:hypothetical protein
MLMSWNYSPASGSLPASDCRSFLISSPWFFSTAWDRLDGSELGDESLDIHGLKQTTNGEKSSKTFISMHPEKTWFNPQNSSIVVIWLYRFI